MSLFECVLLEMTHVADVDGMDRAGDDAPDCFIAARSVRFGLVSQDVVDIGS
jgi:hypothetical protein